MSGRPLRRVRADCCGGGPDMRKTGAEQRIDDEIGRLEVDLIERTDRPRNAAPPPPHRLRRPAPSSLSAHTQSRVAQKPRGDEPVAAVVAGAAEHGRRSAPSNASTASATAAPAFHMSTMPGVPAAMVSRSAAAISSVVTSSRAAGIGAIVARGGAEARWERGFRGCVVRLVEVSRSSNERHSTILYLFVEPIM